MHDELLTALNDQGGIPSDVSPSRPVSTRVVHHPVAITSDDPAGSSP